MKSRTSATIVTACLVSLLWAAPQQARSEDELPRLAKLPTSAEVARVVEQALATNRDYQPGDLLSQSMLEPVWSALAEAGYRLTREQTSAISTHVLGDREFLVEQLQTSAGRKFMRQISEMPMAYEQLDRLSRMPQGHSTIRRLVKGPDGYKMVEYLTMTPGGREMGRMLDGTPKGHDFNRPTGRIYTQDQLLRAIEAYRPHLTPVAIP